MFDWSHCGPISAVRMPDANPRAAVPTRSDGVARGDPVRAARQGHDLAQLRAIGPPDYRPGGVATLWRPAHLGASARPAKSLGVVQRSSASSSSSSLSATTAAAPIKINQPALTVTAECDVTKFSQYALDPTKNTGKDAVFTSLGYDTSHSAELVTLYEAQAEQQCLLGEYELGKRDEYGQRITIVIHVPGKPNAKRPSSDIKSGWMITDSKATDTGWTLASSNRIRLTTPLAGFK